MYSNLWLEMNAKISTLIPYNLTSVEIGPALNCIMVH